MNSKNANLFMYQINEKFFNKFEVYPIFFPIEWGDFLNKITEGYKRKTTLDEIGKYIRLEFPSVFAYSVDIKAISQEKPWLYVLTKKNSLSNLKNHVLDWFYDIDEKLNLDLTEEELSKFENADLDYGLPLTLSEKQENSNVASGLVAVDYCKQIRTYNMKVEIQSGEKKIGEDEKTTTTYEDIEVNLFFNHHFSGGKHEVISDPFSTGVEEGSSIALCFDYFSFPNDTSPFLRIHVSQKRWLSNKDDFKHLKTGHTLFAKFHGIDSRELHSFSIKEKFESSEENSLQEKHFYVKQDSCFKKFFSSRIGLDQILSEIGQHVFHQEWFIAIPFGENATEGAKHPHGSGIEPQIYKGVYEDIQTYYVSNSNFSSVPPIKIKETKKGKVQYPLATKFHKKKTKKTPYQMDFLYSLLKTKARTATIEFWIKNENIFDEFLSMLKENTINFNEVVPNKQYEIYASDDDIFTLYIEKYYQNGTGDKLPFTKNDDEDSRSNKLLLRVNELKTMIENKNRTNPSQHYVLFELENFEGKSRDPKSLIRRTFAQKEIRTQFITPLEIPKEDAKEKTIENIFNRNRNRMIKAFQDVLSKIGFSITISEKETFVDLYSFNYLRIKYGKIKVSIPVLSKVQNKSISFLFFDDKKWYSHSDIIGKINNIRIQVLKKEYPKFEFNELEIEICYQLTRDKNEKILCLPSWLRRNIVEWLRNPFLNEEYEKSNKSFLLSNVSNLSIVRFNSGIDVPSYLAFDKNGETTKTDGLIPFNKHVFFSMARKPDTEQSGKYWSRFSTKHIKKELKDGSTTDITSHHRRNEKMSKRKLTELVVLSNSKMYSKEQIACIVHNSRDLNLTTNFHVNHDFATYLTENLKEYLEFGNYDKFI